MVRGIFTTSQILYSGDIKRNCQPVILNEIKDEGMKAFSLVDELCLLCHYNVKICKTQIYHVYQF